MAAAVVVGAQHREDEKSRREEEALLDAIYKPDDNQATETSAPLPPYLLKCQNLELVKRLDHGQWDLITLAQTQALCKLVGEEKDGKVCAKKIKEVMMRVVKPGFTTDEVDIFLDFCKEEGDYKKAYLSPQDLFDIFHSEKEAIRDLALSRANVDQQVRREEFSNEVARMVDRDDAFVTLPITAIYMLLFVYLVQGHLRIYDRRNAENALEEFINGRDPRETADENIDDIDSLWEWVLEPGLRGPLGSVKNSTDSKFEQCIFASRNILLGDVKLTRTDHDGEETSVWLLHHDTALSYLKKNPGKYRDAAIQSAEHLMNNGWSGSDIGWITMSFSSYNEFTRMFAITNVNVALPKLGNVYSKIDASAVSIEPYPEVPLMVADGLFLCLAMWIGLQEFKDAFAALRLGLSEFKDYWAFWNVVDWANIMFAMVTCVAWFDTITYMRADAFNSILTDYKINTDVMALEQNKVEDMFEQLKALRIRYWFMQIIMAVNTISVVMKFFKSFESNARLKVVSTTFKEAMVDLIHFAIMFSTIFLPFVIIGHILFGSDIKEFASITASINTGIVCLMGDFGWYVEEYPSTFTALLPSGMPKMVLCIWYVSFMFLVFLVLLNMLLAVILEHYTTVAGDVQFEADAPAIWTQAHRFWKFRKETKGFVPLESLRGDLENDEDPAHKEESVTVTSLMNAWPGKMTQKQAVFLMDMLDKNHELEHLCQEKRDKANHVKHLAQENKNKLEDLSDGILNNKGRLDELEGVQGGVSDITTGLEKLVNIVTDLNVSVAKVRREHDRLAVKVDDMMQSIPDGHRLEFVQGAPQERQENVSSSSGRVAREWKKPSPAKKASGDTKDSRESKPASKSAPATKYRSADDSRNGTRKAAPRDKGDGGTTL